MFIDCNNNGKINPTDDGIGMAVNNDNYIDIDCYRFSFVQEIVPRKDTYGNIITYNYEKECSISNKALNKYGHCTFCRFSISSAYKGVCGVYAILDDRELLYIGKTVDLYRQWHNGYGSICQCKCYSDGGQITNCKINSMILQKYQSSNHIYVYFLETENYDVIKNHLIKTLSPPFNG